MFFYNFLYRETLEYILRNLDIHHDAVTIPQFVKDVSPKISADKIKTELLSILFFYLTKHSMSREIADLCRKHLSGEDIEHIHGITVYNYNKLKIIFNYGTN